MSVVVKHYQNRQPAYRHLYTIEYRLQPQGFYGIYCTDHPDNPRGGQPRDVHMYPDGRISVAAGREPRTMELAEAIAHYWMIGFSEYLHRGVFPDNGARVDV